MPAVIVVPNLPLLPLGLLLAALLLLPLICFQYFLQAESASSMAQASRMQLQYRHDCATPL
jgi:hypothetical protein